LRNPIAGILAASECLLDESFLCPSGDHVQLLESIRNSSRSLLRLLDRFMDAASPSSTQAYPDFQDTDIVLLARNNLTINQLLARSKGIQLTLTVEEPPSAIQADPSQVSEVIDNLVANAIKFSPPRGLIDIRVGRRDNMAYISVQDQGPGIPTTVLSTIYETHQKGSNRRRRRKRDTGLGLTIVKRIVEGHRGLIEIETKVGRGSTVTVLLPVSSVQVCPPGVAPVSKTEAGT
jgi:signal transduction histidine kinase